jgi:exosortase
MSTTTEKSEPRSLAPAPKPAARGGRGGLAAQIIAAGAVLGTLLWAYATDVREMVQVWMDDPNYSHGFLVPPVAALIFWQRWPRGNMPRPRPSWIGFVALAVLIGLRAWFYELGEFWIERLTLLASVAALVMAYGGWPLMRRAWPAVVFLIFMYTVPVGLNNRISLPLQGMASWASCGLLRLLGLWVMNEGNVILVGGDQLEVAAACNGLAMLMSLAATITATTILIPMPNWKRVILLLSVVPIALVCNIARIAGTVWCYHLIGSERGRELAHDWAGLLMMPLALILVGLELWWMSWLVTEEEEIVSGPFIGIRPTPSPTP